MIGPSGSGKSTLLRCINLLEEPTSGQVLIGDDEVTDPDVDIDAVRRRIGMVFQQFNLFPHLDGDRERDDRAAPRPAAASKAEAERVAAREPRARRPRRQGATPTPPSSRAASSSGPRSRGRSRWARS